MAPWHRLPTSNASDEGPNDVAIARPRVGDDLLPNIGEIVIVRKPPQPGASASSVNRDSTGESK